MARGHRRTPSDAEFRELTLRDAQVSLHNELEKLIKTSKPEQQTVSHYILISNLLTASGIFCRFLKGHTAV